MPYQEATPVADFVRERFYLLLTAFMIIFFTLIYFGIYMMMHVSDEFSKNVILILVGAFGALLKTVSPKTEIKDSDIKTVNTTDKGDS